ncbi:MAG: hypothetical protein COA57_03760 [Flavobacteriales bacterium]|nr:MAG: hypothetical protein COA57_03760 [Flavobacteriales bacterium]
MARRKDSTSCIEISRKWRTVLTLLLLIFIGCFFAQKIIFVNADLGRHIKNGELLFEEGKIISTNFYSYTEPDFPVVTHHWGSGALFYLIWKWFGFKGLSILSILVNTLAVFFFFQTAQKKGSFTYVLLVAVLCIPLIVNRTEIRPEMFSYLLMGVFYWLFHQFQTDKIRLNKLLLILIPLQIIWVNTHLFFVFGLFICGIFCLDGWLNDKDRLKHYSIVFAGLVIVSFINPFGWKGFVEPFLILREYGYMIAENQPVFFMQDRFPENPVYWHFEAIFLLSFILILIATVKTNERKKLFAPFVLFAFLSILAFKMVRGIPIFGLFLLPIATQFLQEIHQSIQQKRKKTIQVTILFFSIIVIGMGFFTKSTYYTPFNQISGIGLISGVNRSAQFLKSAGIQGPVFNNYDIGSYLIFHLFSQYQVFVDNRPEAYSISFFKNIYEPMQEREEKWNEMDEKYGINCIYFFRHDNTPHAQPFLIRRIEDPKWAPVFVDDFAIIFLKRNEKNAVLIRQYELPKEMFRSVPGN